LRRALFFESNKNQNVFKRVSLNPKRDDLEERGNDVRNKLSFALFISHNEALLLLCAIFGAQSVYCSHQKQRHATNRRTFRPMLTGRTIL